MEVSFLPQDSVTSESVQDSQRQKPKPTTHKLPQSVNMKIQPSTSTSKLSAGLQNINPNQINNIPSDKTKQMNRLSEGQKATCFAPSLSHHQANFDLHKY
jgi:hypothetical protein